ncbi:PglL family O-oligosaccharyltransferase [Neisseria shayeganii]|uniref:O-antigen polymerase superfamily protein n=1 Tax=Neisseria shayeganii 871 TaxID=1032488 RepID=G4CK39_9NEIS|nr:Wzy polymerase domain-containing protein [Neisseria shayeganii]EGY51766.1 O-antigen polymerase superfamily protein [Neisseria shayeganii 871]
MFKPLRQSGVMWMGMLLLAVVPFLSSWRTGPQGGWLIESGSLLFAMLFVLLTAVQGGRLRLPAVSWYFLALAVFWAVQARVLALPYAEMSDLTAAVWLGMALLAWACRVQVARLGQLKAADIFAWALLAGGLLQALVCVLQFGEWTAWLPGLMNAPGRYFVFGQLGQRNHLGHYMMWGVLAAAYLWSRKQLPNGWAAGCALLLLGVVGLITSRTMLLYLAALAALLPVLYWRGGPALKRWCLLTGLMLLGVLLAQWLVMPLLSALLDSGGSIGEASGLSRMAGGNTASPGRAAEWAKAWQVFLAHPVLGVGWQGYSHESFAWVMRDGSFRDYDPGVLFTHSHNSFLQILAEMGWVGGLLVFGGWLAVVSGYLKRPVNEASAWMLCLMTVSLCHSLLEYPLWYVYFLAPFAVMMSLTPMKEAFAGANQTSAGRWLWGGLAALVAALTLYYGVAYYRLAHAYGKPSADWPHERQLAQLERIERWDYFLRYYAHMGLLRKVDIQRKPLPAWGREAALRASRFRPYANTAVRAFYLDQEGQEQEAAAWLLNMGRYYPTMMQRYLDAATTYGVSEAVVLPLRQACWRYRETARAALKCGGVNQ